VWIVTFAVPSWAHAEAGDSEAVRIAALRTEARTYEHGEGVAKDALRASELYCEAARLGDAESQYSLGWMYANGRGVSRNDGLASHFFGLAAAQGHRQAGAMARLAGPPAGDAPECMREPPLSRYNEEAPDFSALNDEPFFALTPEQSQIADLVFSLAPEYRVSPQLALAIIRIESNFDPRALSPKKAQGLMQLIPETALRFGVTKPFDPAQNIRGGLAYLRWLLAYFQGDVALVAAAYNAGERAVDRYRGIPPYAETRAYVKRILRHYKRDTHPYDGRVTEPSPELQRIRVGGLW
jgi:hypothetical protein